MTHLPLRHDLRAEPSIQGMTEAEADAVIVVARLLARLVAEQVEARAETGSPGGEGGDGFLTVEQAAAYLACGPDRIYDLVAQRRLTVHKDGRRSLFLRRDLDAALTRVEAPK